MRQAYQHYLRLCLSPLVQAIGRIGDMPPSARSAALASAESALFGLATLQRQSSLDELVAALVASPAQLDVSPTLLGLYIAAQRRRASALYPLPARGGDEPSRAAAETHELTRVRAAVWTFFEQIIAARPSLAVLLGCVERIGPEGMYATGSIECRATLAATVDRALERAEGDEDAVAAYVLAVVEVDERAVSPHLSRVFALVARSRSAANVALVSALRSHAARTRQLPAFVERLVSMDVAERDAKDVLGGPLLGVEATRALAVDLRAALSGSQLLPLVERLVSSLRAAIDAPDAEPAPKKRRTSSPPVASSSSAVRSVITAHVLATVIEAGEVAKAQLGDLISALESIAEDVGASADRHTDQHVVATSLHLRHAALRRLVQLGRSIAGPTPELRQSSPDVMLASVRNRLLLSELTVAGSMRAAVRRGHLLARARSRRASRPRTELRAIIWVGRRTQLPRRRRAAAGAVVPRPALPPAPRVRISCSVSADTAAGSLRTSSSTASQAHCSPPGRRHCPPASTSAL